MAKKVSFVKRKNNTLHKVMPFKWKQNKRYEISTRFIHRNVGKINLFKYCEYCLFGGRNDRLRELPDAEQSKRY